MWPEHVRNYVRVQSLSSSSSSSSSPSNNNNNNNNAMMIPKPLLKGWTNTTTASFDLGGISHHTTNIEALTDILIISKYCTYLLHGWSAMTEAVFYLNPSFIYENRS